MKCVRSLAIAVSLMLRWLQWLSMKKRSPLKCNVLIHILSFPLVERTILSVLTRSEGVYLRPEAEHSAKPVVM